jgi:hypothetical protein
VRFTWNFTAGIAAMAKIDRMVITIISSVSVTPASPERAALTRCLALTD